MSNIQAEIEEARADIKKMKAVLKEMRGAPKLERLYMLNRLVAKYLHKRKMLPDHLKHLLDN